MPVAAANAPGVLLKKSTLRYDTARTRLEALNPFLVPKDSSMSDNAVRTRYMIVYRNPLYRQKTVQRSADDAMRKPILTMNMAFTALVSSSSRKWYTELVMKNMGKKMKARVMQILSAVGKAAECTNQRIMSVMAVHAERMSTTALNTLTG